MSYNETKVFKLNGPIKKFIQSQIKDDNDTNNIINSFDLNKDDINDKDENNLDENKNKIILNSIKEDFKEENKIEIQEYKIDSVNNNDNITTNNSNQYSKEGSANLTNELNMKESKEKENKNIPDIIIVKKNSFENNNITNRGKENDVNTKKNE